MQRTVGIGVIRNGKGKARLGRPGVTVLPDRDAVSEKSRRGARDDFDRSPVVTHRQWFVIGDEV